MKETVSDIIDQRLESDQVGDRIETIAADVEGLRAWRNYHLIGDVIRGEVDSAGSCLIGRVSLALTDEPTVLAPSSANRAPDAGGVVTGSASPVATAEGSRGDTLKAAGLFAVAASLALVAVITQLPTTDGPGGDQSLARNAASPTTAVTAGEGLAAGNPGAADEQAFASEFGQMLVEHGEFSAATGLNGLLAYAKIVSNEPLGD